MEHPEERYYKLNRFLLSASGLWPYQSLWTACLFRAIITIVLLSYILAQFTSFSTSNINVEFITDMLPVITVTLGSVVQIYIRVIHADKLRELFERMGSDWALQKTEDEIKIMHEYAETTRLMMFYFSLITYTVTGIYGISLCMTEILDIISPLNESRPRPRQVEFYTDEERYFYLIRSHVFLGLLISSTVIAAIMNLFLAVTQHVCAMCKLLGFVHIIDTYHSFPFLLSLVGILPLLTFTLMQILTISGNTERAIKSIGLAIMQLCYIFVFSKMGQKVTDMTSSICEKVYNSAWYDADVSEQKSLLLIMKRRFHPLLLTAYNFYVMSLQNFGVIIQTAISYCMFIRQI